MVWQQMDYLKPLREFKDRIFHVHAKDVRLDRDRLNDVGILATPLEYHTPKLPGLGDVNWGRFFSVLSDIGYAGPVCVEVEDRAYEDSLETRKSALRQSCAIPASVHAIDRSIRMDYTYSRHRQDDRPLAAEPDADRPRIWRAAASWRCEYDVASVCIMPYYLQAVRRAAARAARSRPARRSASRTAGTRPPIKVAEAEQALADGGAGTGHGRQHQQGPQRRLGLRPRDIAAVIDVTHARRAEGQGHLRELLPEQRPEDPALRDLRRAAAPIG